jgi:phosphinothricin tripeptide acetyl hydrolase
MPSAELAALIAGFRAAESPPGTVEEWRAAWDAMTLDVPLAAGVTTTDVDAGGVPAIRFEPEAAADGPVVVYHHGGAFGIGAPRNVAGYLSVLATEVGGRVVGVDYRLAPEHPYPAALDDALTAYRWLLETGVTPDRIVLGGDSCGANLAVASMLQLRDAGDPLPAAAVCVSPWVDLEQTSSTFGTKTQDPFITKETLDYFASLYLAGTDPKDKLTSPIYANLAGLPRVLIQVGGSERLLGDALLLTKALGSASVPVTTKSWPHVVHAWPTWATIPESRRAIARMAHFARAATSETANR